MRKSDDPKDLLKRLERSLIKDEINGDNKPVSKRKERLSNKNDDLVREKMEIENDIERMKIKREIRKLKQDKLLMKLGFKK